ncbi:hypothetical protein Tco_1338098 [Tanacetum coccineum]
MVRACVLDFRGSWDVHLPLVEFSYNKVEVGEGQLIGSELVQETTEKISQIKDRLKAARDRQKSYVDKCRLRKLDLPEELNGVYDTFHVSNLKKCLADPTLKVPLDEIRVDAKLNFVEEPMEILEREFKKLKRSRIAIVKVRWNSKLALNSRGNVKIRCARSVEVRLAVEIFGVIPIVKDLVPIPSESKDTSESDSDCDLPSCDDFSPINIPEGNSMTFSNPLFYSNGDFTFSDNESLSDEDVLEDNVKIYLNPFFKFDDEHIFSDINPLFDEVLENIESKDSYVFRPQEAILIIIDAFLDVDISMDIENDYHDSEGDIIYLESLLIDDTIPNLPPKVFLDHDSKNLKDKPDNKDLKSMVKVFDPGIWEKIFSPTYVRLPFEDCHYLSLTYVI